MTAACVRDGRVRACAVVVRVCVCVSLCVRACVRPSSSSPVVVVIHHRSPRLRDVSRARGDVTQASRWIRSVRVTFDDARNATGRGRGVDVL